MRSKLEADPKLIPDEHVQYKVSVAIAMTYGSLLQCSQYKLGWLTGTESLSVTARAKAIRHVKHAALHVRDICGPHLMEAAAMLSLLQKRIEREEGRTSENLPEGIDEVLVSLVRSAIVELGTSCKTKLIQDHCHKNRDKVLKTLRYLKDRGEYIGQE